MAADTGMETCPSPEVADSRKRPPPLDHRADDPADVKRSHFSSGGDGMYHFKTLVPSVAAGAIIGKGGEAIAQLQKDTGARVKMSKSHDFYPGTSERVCLVTGSVEAIMAVMDFIMDKIREKPDLTKSFTELDPKVAQERDKQVKILVPNSTAGMIIGKAGNYIKQIKEASGSYVQISQKAKDISLQERCITVIGDRESNKKACMMILAKVVDDPQSGSCLNVSYADVVGPVANYNPTGSPYAHSQQAHAFSSSTASLNNSGLGSVGGTTSVLVNGSTLGSLNLTLNIASPQVANSNITSQMLDNIKLTLRNSGYSENGVGEICAALGLLAKHGILGLGITPLPTSASLPSALPYFPLTTEQSATASVFGPIGPVNLVFRHLSGNTSPTTRNSLERYAADVAFETAFRSPAVAPISLNNNSFGLATGGAPGQGLAPLSKSPTPGDLGAKDQKNVEIAEVIVGAILGPGGRNLIEIQHLSGANIQISKKGTFAPGTRNRIVTISGSQNAIGTAQYLIEQRISEEEIKRARHTTLSGIIQ
ncbi:RNA-binding protein Nova-1-like protein passilla isoform X3 [Arctopsyche grandis]|uniref:RNA-binding protein Nova-1-like protein passilla isoform X3 n=1 Tax=Arctopsyche grandis TaxID=121162 RepID=UPI00406D8D5F